MRRMASPERGMFDDPRSIRILSSALLGGSADGGGLGAFKDGVRGAGAVVEDDQADGGAHEDDGGPGGEAREHIGGSAGSEGGLRALRSEEHTSELQSPM